MSFLTPLGFVSGLLAVPVILLYMLRLRRREVPISSSFLWQQILQDNEANTPWQRLRRNLLLFLQLLILLLLVIALARPFLIVSTVSAGQIVLLLDASASMNATDSEGGTRFEEAQAQALEIVDTLSDSDSMTVIRVGAVPEVLAASTNDQTVLRAAINDAQPSFASADWGAALTLASAGASGASEFNVVVISDGGLGTASGLPGIPGEIRYVPVGQSGQNIAITALATRLLPGQEPQLFAQVTNYGAQDNEVIFDLRVDNELFTAQRINVPAGEDVPLVSEALPDDFGTLQAGITIASDSDVPDYLSADDNAWAVSPGLGNRRALLMTPGNLFLEQVMQSLPGVQAFKGDLARGLPNLEFDLYIFDTWLPEQLPEGDILIVNPPGNTTLFTIGEQISLPTNITVRRDDPRTSFLDFEDVNILQFTDISDADWAAELISADGQPLLLAGEVDGRQAAVITFDIHNSDLPLQISWPILMANLLDWFTPRDAISVPGGLRVGDSLVVRPPFDADSIEITSPGGEQRLLVVDRDTLVFADTVEPGLYLLDILAGEETLQRAPFAVNLFDAGESDIVPRESIELSGITITETEREEVGQREFWPWLALLGLIILLIEWYVYHQRLRVPTAGRVVLRRRRAG